MKFPPRGLLITLAWTWPLIVLAEIGYQIDVRFMEARRARRMRT